MVSLFSASLERHMSAYMDEVKQNQLNQSFQLAQNRILRESQLMNLSQADTMNRLNTLREELIKQMAKPTNIPLSKTNAPEIKEEKETFIKPSINIPSRKSSPLQKEIEEKKANLKKTPPIEKKTTPKSKFETELQAKANKISPSSTGASTESNSASVGLMPRNPTFAETKRDFVDYLTRKKILDVNLNDDRFKGMGAQAEINKEYSRLLAIHGEGLKRKNKKKKEIKNRIA